MDWVQILTDVGVLAGLVVFFAWTSWQREVRLARRIDHLEAFYETKLVTIVESSTTHLKTNSDALRKNTETMQRLIERLRDRPCMLDDRDKLTGAIGRVLTRSEVMGKPSPVPGQP